MLSKAIDHVFGHRIAHDFLQSWFDLKHGAHLTCHASLKEGGDYRPLLCKTNRPVGAVRALGSLTPQDRDGWL